MAKRPVPKYDFKAFGAAIKAARTGRKESRKKVSDEMFILSLIHICFPRTATSGQYNPGTPRTAEESADSGRRPGPVPPKSHPASRLAHHSAPDEAPV